MQFSFYFIFLAVNNTARRHYGKGRRHPLVTFNDMPKPEGDFFALHAQRQRINNTVLAVGVAMNAFGLFMVN